MRANTKRVPFRDAASAAIVGGSPKRYEQPLGQVLLSRSMLIPDTIDYVRIKDCDDATISWYNSKILPEKICENVPPMLKELLNGTGLSLQELQYAVHPGGPKILDVLAEALGVGHEQLEVSWEVLTQVGNSSGSSNLLLLHRELERAQGPDDFQVLPEHVMCIGTVPACPSRLSW